MLANAITMDEQYQVVVSGAHDQTLHIFDKQDSSLGNEIEVRLGEGPINCVRIAHQLLERFAGHMAIVDDVDIDPSGQMIVSVSRDFTAKVYRLDDGKLLHSFCLGHRSPKGVCFLDPQTVIVTNYWGSLLRIDLRSGEILSRPIAENGISAVARSGEYLVAVSYDGVAYLVRPADLGVANTLRSMQQRLHPSALIRPAALATVSN
jgi:WD40 repeat protein